MRAASLKKSAWCQAYFGDLGDFKKGIASDEIEDRPKNSRKKFRKLNPAEATPVFFINGGALSDAQPLENFVRVIDDELARTR